MSSIDHLLVHLDNTGFFTADHLDFDLQEGVIWNAAKTRVCLLSTDFLTGVYKGLVEEAGPAWHLIFKQCGIIWGRRLSERLDRECATLLNRSMGEMQLEDFLGFITSYFLFHGWGRLEINVSRAAERGLVEASLTHSVFTEIVDDPDQMADPMIAGILESLVSHLSGTTLQCVQTECPTKGGNESLFLIGAAERLARVPDSIRLGTRHTTLVESL
jgi:uncharacterized protein